MRQARVAMQSVLKLYKSRHFQRREALGRGVFIYTANSEWHKNRFFSGSEFSEWPKNQFSSGSEFSEWPKNRFSDGSEFSE